MSNEKSFNEWLGGLIDGNGQILVTKKGYAYFKIVLPEKDKSILYEIKHKFGGSIKNISGSNSFKYKLHHKKGLAKMVYSINGLIRNPAKLLQLNKVCVLYNIDCKCNIPLTYNSRWFSGIIDANGSITLNEQCDQLILSITLKNRLLLDPLNKLFMGRVKILNSKDAFKYSIFRKNEILDLIDNYFSKYPLISNKAHKLKIIKDFYLYNNYKEELNKPDKLYKWINFKNKWDKL
uniref:LAGLIDADG homing endonuclease-like protein n=1 Tax=Coccocarpia palmicola TaxID=301477 RepID=A0A1V0FW48_9LECA|nr:LAGLIDADG homing endonuclease-like protein [Coccocarpia palmicola]ARB49958.1 LAGLIDADG homing endonuclease-like protein [Coccocarpia palmicola]